MYNLDDFVKINKILLPTGRAYRMNNGSNKEFMSYAINNQRLDTYRQVVGLLDGVLPDNENFDEWYCDKWEQTLGLASMSGMDIIQRRIAILEAMTYPSDSLYQGSALYMEWRLNLAGFNVTVHQNRFSNGSGGFEPHDPSLYMTSGNAVQHGQIQHGQKQHGSFTYNIIANYMDEAKDKNFVIAGLKNTFFVSGGGVGGGLGTIATIDLRRKQEFRKLILKIKYAHLVGFLNVQYI